MPSELLFFVGTSFRIYGGGKMKKFASNFSSRIQLPLLLSLFRHPCLKFLADRAKTVERRATV